jgi:VanZ family protein
LATKVVVMAPTDAAGASLRRTTALPLLGVWVLLIVYASLFPFEGWNVPSGLSVLSAMSLPWPPWRDRFDEVANLVGYMPFGALACIAAIRGGRDHRQGVLIAVVLAAGVSYAVEVAQSFLPVRVPSLKDTAFNVTGAGIGAAMAAVLHHGGFTQRWQRVREFWFERNSAVAITLLMLWPVGLLFPAPVPLALGHSWSVVADAVLAAVDGTPWAPAVQDWLNGLPRDPSPAGSSPPGDSPLHTLHELAMVGLGFLAPCLLAYACTARPKHRLILATGAMLLAMSVTTLAVAMSFGPDHALAWLTPRVALGLCVGVALAASAVALPPRWAAWWGVLVVVGLLAAVAFAPSDPYYAAYLSSWEQGRFMRFHGVAQWVGWLWPYGAVWWLLLRGWRR